jgi:hypothetical protein
VSHGLNENRRVSVPVSRASNRRDSQGLRPDPYQYSSKSIVPAPKQGSIRYRRPNNGGSAAEGHRQRLVL